MSKGYGTIQRKIADFFADNPDKKFPIWRLVEYVSEEPPYSKAQYNSVARAAKTVAKVTCH